MSFIKNSINCDSSYLFKKDMMEWKVKDTLTGELLILNRLEGGTNNIGEFFAIVESMLYLRENNSEHLPIYTDSYIAMKWVKNAKCKTNRFDMSEELKKMIEDYEKVCLDIYEEFTILKWKTNLWGEIPSDFNRK